MEFQNSETRSKLGFEKILDLLAKSTYSDLSAEHISKISTFSDIEVIKLEFAYIRQIMKLSEHETSLPLSSFFDISQYFSKLKINQYRLTPNDFLRIKSTISVSLAVLKFVKSSEFLSEEFKNLAPLIQKELSDLFSKINICIGDDSQILDSASHNLAQIRSKILLSQQSLRKKSQEILKKLVKAGIAASEHLSLRNERVVVPIYAEYKNKVHGFVHDISSTGQTLYVEPSECLQLNNQLKALQYEEEKELEKILLELTEFVGGFVDVLQHAVSFLVRIDVLNAKAEFAKKIDASTVRFTNNPKLSLVQARHPLLILQNLSELEKVKAFDLELDSEKRILIISGPNAGGKTVLLKAAGLLQLMAQAAIPIPVDSDSLLPVVDEIFVDIGDSQSIDNQLSTYSSHLINLKNVLENATEKSLILLDEFGAGTDPDMGSAVAIAFIKRLIQLRSLALVTTHFNAIKLFGEEHPQILSGAMQWDAELLEPKYTLKTGSPGSSYAFEIAKKSGLPYSLINDAQNILGEEKTDLESLLVKLKEQEQALKELEDENKKKTEQLSALIAKYDSVQKEIIQKKSQILKDAEKQALEILASANKKIENTIRKIKETKAEKAETKILREKLNQEIQSKKQNLKRIDSKAQKQVKKTEFKIGDTVKIKNSSTIAEIISIKNKNAEITTGNLKTKVPLHQLEHAKQRKQENQRKVKFDDSETRKNFKTTLDVRGMRVEQALDEIQKYLDDAKFLDALELKIIHGKGTGALKTAVHEYFTYKLQDIEFREGTLEEGGVGVTFCSLK